jgi:hypothetical protein
MNRDEITKIIWDNGLFHGTMALGVVMDADHLEKFANLVAAAEREACAKACEVFSVDRGMIEDEILKKGVLAGAAMCAFAIRERGAP